jgi:hypothetical protein
LLWCTVGGMGGIRTADIDSWNLVEKLAHGQVERTQSEELRFRSHSAYALHGAFFSPDLTGHGANLGMPDSQPASKNASDDPQYVHGWPHLTYLPSPRPPMSTCIARLSKKANRGQLSATDCQTLQICGCGCIALPPHNPSNKKLFFLLKYF